MATSGKSSGAAPAARRSPRAGSSVAVPTVPAALEPDASAVVPSDAGLPAVTLDPGAAVDASRHAVAPALRAQLEALKAIERFGRYQYGVAGDYLEWSMAQARASLTIGTPAEHIASQVTLSTQFSGKLQDRVREFVDLASETQASFNHVLVDATAKLAETIKQSC